MSSRLGGRFEHPDGDRNSGGCPWSTLTAVVIFVLIAVAGRAATHPPLIDVEQTDCSACHQTDSHRTSGDESAAECTSCHEVTISALGTALEMKENEPQLCLGCHADQVDAAAQTVEFPHPPLAGACSDCHEPHSSPRPHLLRAETPELCAECHTGRKFERKHGGQLAAISDCGSCHEAHGSNREHFFLHSRLHPPFTLSCAGCHRDPFGGKVRLQARDETLCTGCHGTKHENWAEGGSIHAALDGPRGLPGCVSCHDPHMSRQRKLLRQKVPALCGECHADVVARAEAPGGHPPAAADCRACHRPHAAAEPKLLTRPIETLCLGCHGTPEISEVHLGAVLAELRCTSCHDPHGTVHPHQLASTPHPPVIDGCENCHEGAFDQLQEDGRSALCLRCHQEIGQLAETATVPHQALESGDCRDCHNPHASPQEKLVKAPGAGPCVDCHLEMKPNDTEQAHGVIDLLGCRACHEPHGGEREHLLRLEAGELCLSCHDPSRLQIDSRSDTVQWLGKFEVPAQVARRAARLRLSPDGERNHPVAGHRVVGQPSEQELRRVETNFEGELGCLSCHDPHKGRVKLLRWDVETTFGACTHCHSK